jgi:hypothetical protein
MSNYGAMVTRIGSELQRSDIDDQIKRGIVTAIDHWGRKRFYWNEATGLWETAASTRQYAEGLVTGSGTVPAAKKTDTLKVTVNGSDYPMTERGWDYIDSITTRSTLTGYPMEYAYYENKYWFYPIPNGSMTIAHSYVKALTEVSFSSTANATNAWMTSAEELIRQRAKAVVRIDVLHSAEAKAEAMNLAGTDCLSVMEKTALDGVVGETVAKASGGGRIKPTKF